MIVDMILDRKDGEPYNEQEFYKGMIEYENESIIRAFETNNDDKIKEALREYIKGSMFNPEISEYINSVKWSGNIKPIEWKKYWWCAWNNYRGEGYVYPTIITKSEIDKAGGIDNWEMSNHRVLYETEAEADRVLAFHYDD